MKLSLLVIGLLVARGTSAGPPQGPPDLTVDNKVDRAENWNLGPTGMRGWIFTHTNNNLENRQGRITTASRQILVTDVGKGTPADGVVEIEDVILGVGGKPFTADARESLGRAITAAETDAGGGRLELLLWRKGNTQTVTLKLPVMGAYSETAPYDCPKSAKILAGAISALEKEELDKGRGMWGGISALALLATGKPEYLPKVADYARLVSAREVVREGGGAWDCGYVNLFLCEYYLLTGDREVLPAIRVLTDKLARGQGMYGTFGHGFSALRPDGGLHGSIPPYGPVNQAGLIANFSIVLAKRCGITDPEVEAAIDRATTFLSYYVNKGSIPYGEHEPEPFHENNGKSALTALLFATAGGHPRETRYFAQLAVAGFSNRQNGHTGQGFSYLWGGLGANQGGPAAAAAFFGGTTWQLDLLRRSDGAFTYDGGEQHGPGRKNEQDSRYFGNPSYYGLSPTASYMLTLAVPLKKLIITGRESAPAGWLSKAEAKEAYDAGLADLTRTEKSPKELLAALSSWSPIARGWAAEELATRPEAKELVPALFALTEDADDGTRQGACEALGLIKDARVPPVLVRALSDRDTWVRAKAAKGLNHLGNLAKPEVEAMLKAFIANARPAEPIDWNDPMQIANGYLAETLFAGGLAGTTVGVRKELLYPAVRIGLKHPSGMWRNKLDGFIKDKLTAEDVQALIMDVIEVARTTSPADTMFSPTPRAAGIQTLAKYRIAEGIPLALEMQTVMERYDHSSQIFRSAGLRALASYGDAARWTLPTLQAFAVQWDTDRDDYKELVKSIGVIARASSAPSLTSGLPVAEPQVVVASGAVPVVLAGTDASGAELTFAIAGQPAHGTLAGTPPKMVYSPSPGYRGVDRFAFTVANGTVESTPGIVSVIIGEAGRGLKADYFRNSDLKTPVATRIEAINANWGEGAPDPLLSPSNFTVRWRGQVLAPETGTYTFSVLNTDGVQLRVDGVQVINESRVQPLRWTDGAPVELQEGRRYDLTLVCQKMSGPAAAKLKWTGPALAGRNGVVIDKEWLFDQIPAGATAPPVFAQKLKTEANRESMMILSTGRDSTESLTYTITEPPQHGTLAGVAPTLTYTPTAGFTGQDRFTYQISVGASALAPASVAIVVGGERPAAAAQEVTEPIPAGAMTIKAGEALKVGKAEDVTGGAILMQGGTLNLLGGLDEGQRLILATGTVNTVDTSPKARGGAALRCRISGGGALVLTGERDIVMKSNVSDYTGGTRITLGGGARLLVESQRAFGTGTVVFAGADGPVPMSISSSNPAGFVNDIHLESGVIYSQTYNNLPLKLAGSISGPGGLTKTFDAKDKGTRLQLLGLNSTFSGGIVFKSGYLDVLSASSLGSGAVVMGGKASPEHVVAFVNLAPMTVYNSITLNGVNEVGIALPSAATEFRVDQNLEVAGSLTGTGGLLKTGDGHMIITGVNLGSGPTVIQAGTLTYGAAASFGSGPIEIADAAKIGLDYVGTKRLPALRVAGKDLEPGTYGSKTSIATLKDDKHFAGTGMITIGDAGATTVTLTLQPEAKLLPKAKITVVAKVVGSNPAGNVILFDNGTKLATAPLKNGEASLNTNKLTAGWHTLTAAYEGDSANQPGVSAVLDLQIGSQ